MRLSAVIFGLPVALHVSESNIAKQYINTAGSLVVYESVLLWSSADYWPWDMGGFGENLSDKYVSETIKHFGYI